MMLHNDNFGYSPFHVPWMHEAKINFELMQPEGVNHGYYEGVHVHSAKLTGICAEML